MRVHTDSSDNAIKTTSWLLNIFDLVFNYKRLIFNQPQNINYEITTDERVNNILKPKDQSKVLLMRAKEFVNADLIIAPYCTKTGSQNIVEIMIRIAMHERPEYFECLDKKDEVTSDKTYKIFKNFIREFHENDTLNIMVNSVKRTIDHDQKLDNEQKQGFIGFIDILARFIQHIINISIYTQPLNNLNASIDNIQKQCFELFNIIKLINPNLKTLEHTHELRSYLKENAKKNALEDFIKYITNLGQLITQTPSENIINEFFEYISRWQYGSIFYKITCESFEPEHRNNPVHKLTTQILAVSMLDTINKSPKIAKSCMPNRSIDGKSTKNFGRKHTQSEAHKEWIKNQLVTSCSDIIIDALHSVVDLGKDFDTEEFLSLLNNNLHDINPNSFYTHKYYHLITKFELYLLEKQFNVKFISDGYKTVISELKKVVNCQEMIEISRSLLQEFKEFATEMIKFRPNDAQSQEGCSVGGVFGIGFNGKLFGVDYSDITQHKIWIGFSNFGINNGGNIFLEFVREYSSQYYNSSNIADNSITDEIFTKYKQLIKWNIFNYLKLWSINIPELSQYIVDERNKYNGFLLQISMKNSFEQFDDKLKGWINNMSNWYKLPCTIKIATPILPKEHGLQEFARNLVFDSLILKQQFFERHSDLIDLSFLHWKQEVLKSIKTEQVSKFEDLSPQLQEEVKLKLSEIICSVHGEILEHWVKAIENSTKSFKNKKVKELTHTIRETKQKISKLIKTEEKPEEKNQLGQKLTRLEEEKKIWEKSIDQIDGTQYEELRKNFFKDATINQCVEPSFMKCIDHDRFFSVFISKSQAKNPVMFNSEIFKQDKSMSEVAASILTNEPDMQQGNNISTAASEVIGKLPLFLGTRYPYNAIDPCDSKCQYHALGHLYAGDMLLHQSIDQLHYIRQIHGLGEVKPEVTLDFE